MENGLGKIHLMWIFSGNWFWLLVEEWGVAVGVKNPWE